VYARARTLARHCVFIDPFCTVEDVCVLDYDR
jgi:hypothetical protein